MPDIPPSPQPPSSTARRGSISQSLRFAGGVNSLDRFASSYTRAQSFLVFDAPSALTSQPAPLSLFGSSSRRQTARDSIPLLFRDPARHADDTGGESSAAHSGVADETDENAIDFSDDEEDALFTHSDDSEDNRLTPIISGASLPPHHAAPTESNALPKKQPQADELIGGGQRVVLDQSKGRVLVVPGRSTAPQTVFNSVNVLIGIGLLSLPLAISYSGWLIGIVFMCIAAAITLYTAKVLARCLDTDPSLVTYADIAYAAFGARARLLTSLLFSLELLGSCVALVVLFADSIYTLMPGALSKTQLKILAFFILSPLSFLPLSVLSFSSILGILSTFSILVIVFIDGLIKTQQPGTLWHPMPSNFLPSNWKAVPLSLGLLMAPWCGHSVFPNVYRDMRHPYKFKRCLNISYIFTFFVDMAMGVIGLLMFGDDFVTEEITNTIIETKGFPRGLSIAIIVLIAFIPLSKTPLNARPIITTLEVLLGVSASPTPLELQPDGPIDIEGDVEFERIESSTRRHPLARLYHKLKSPEVARAAIIVAVNLIVVIIAIVFPAFDRIMALVGSALGFTICIVLPLAFYLKIFGPGSHRYKNNNYISPGGHVHLGRNTHTISNFELAFDVFAIIAGVVLATVGGVWALLPDEMIFS
ncbi:transmembrane amino acid transporter protein-domain-containing protein [Kockiozyma suomiensis]|uniref:transmembrane amino acid transporter protein-domain-containing protein n=1 Tax=Kockiozyma suomiensis TaxID=1337062 RepID=UPI003342F514